MIENGKLRLSKRNVYLFTAGAVIFVFACIYSAKNANLHIGVYYSLYILSLIICTYAMFKMTRFNFLNPAVLFCGMYCVTICIGPLILLPQNYHYGFNPLPIIISSYVLFLVGYSISPNIYKRLNTTFRFSKRLNRYEVLLVLIVFSLIGWLLYFLPNAGMIFGGDFENDRIEMQSNKGVFLYTAKLWILTIPMLYEEMKRRGKIEKWFVTVVILVAGALIMLGGRSPVVMLVFELVMCKILIENYKTDVLVWIGMISIIIGGILGAIRGMVSGLSITIMRATRSIFLNGNYNLSYIFTKFPAIIPFQRGRTYLINLKMMLPGPDVDFTLWLKRQLGLNFAGGGVTPTIIGEFYLNFGYVGVVIGMLLMGFVAKRLYLHIMFSDEKAYVSFLCVCFMLSVQGGVANCSIQVILYSFVYYIIKHFTRT